MRCLLRIKKRHCRVNGTCPLYTSQKRASTSALRQLFNNLIGAGKERRRHGEADCLSGLEVDHQLEFGRALHWKVGGLFALKDAIDVASSLPVLISRVSSVRDEATCSDEETERIDRRLAGDRYMSALPAKSARRSEGRDSPSATMQVSGHSDFIGGTARRAGAKGQGDPAEGSRRCVCFPVYDIGCTMLAKRECSGRRVSFRVYSIGCTMPAKRAATT